MPWTSRCRQPISNSSNALRGAFARTSRSYPASLVATATLDLAPISLHAHQALTRTPLAKVTAICAQSDSIVHHRVSQHQSSAQQVQCARCLASCSRLRCVLKAISARAASKPSTQLHRTRCDVQSNAQKIHGAQLVLRATFPHQATCRHLSHALSASSASEAQTRRKAQDHAPQATTAHQIRYRSSARRHITDLASATCSHRNVHLATTTISTAATCALNAPLASYAHVLGCQTLWFVLRALSAMSLVLTCLPWPVHRVTSAGRVRKLLTGTQRRFTNRSRALQQSTASVASPTTSPTR